jgi:hypothetical protein
MYMYACVYICVCVRACACMYVCMYVCAPVGSAPRRSRLQRPPSLPPVRPSPSPKLYADMRALCRYPAIVLQSCRWTDLSTFIYSSTLLSTESVRRTLLPHLSSPVFSSAAVNRSPAAGTSTAHSAQLCRPVHLFQCQEVGFPSWTEIEPKGNDTTPNTSMLVLRQRFPDTFPLPKQKIKNAHFQTLCEILKTPRKT